MLSQFSFSRSHRTTGYWYQGNHPPHSIPFGRISSLSPNFPLYFAVSQFLIVSRALSLSFKKKLFAYYFIVPLLLQQKQYDTGTERLGCMKCTVHLPAPISFLTLFYCTVTEEKEIKEMVRSGSRGSEGKKEGE
jgi:hypothetical protein